MVPSNTALPVLMKGKQEEFLGEEEKGNSVVPKRKNIDFILEGNPRRGKSVLTLGRHEKIPGVFRCFYYCPDLVR